MQYPEQFAEVSIVEAPPSYEAYLYRFKNLENQKKYLGIHKGTVEDEYWHSSKNVEFAKAFANPNSKFLYEVLEYGKYDYLTYKEHKMLSDVDAKNNPQYYNLSNGISKYKVADLPKCQALVEQILNREIEVTYEDLQDHVDMETLQIRYQYDAALQREIKERIDDAGGSTAECNPVVVWVNRKVINGKRVDLRGDGNHTVSAIAHSKHATASKIPVMRISEEIHQNFSDAELRTVGILLNPIPKMVKGKSKLKDGVKLVKDSYYEDNIPTDSPAHDATLRAVGYSRRERATIINKAIDQVEKEEEETHGRIFINYRAHPALGHLNNDVEAEKDKDTHCFAVNSSVKDMVESIANNVRTSMDRNKHYMKVKIWHLHPTGAEDWINKWGANHWKNVEMFFLNPINPKTGKVHKMTIEFEPQPMWQKNTPKAELNFEEEK